MNDKASDSNRLSGGDSPEHGVAKKVRANTLTLPVSVYRETPQENDWNRVGHVPSEFANCNAMKDRACSDTIVAHRSVAGGCYERAGRALQLVRSCTSLEPFVERRFAGIEIVEEMARGKRLGARRPAWWGHFSQAGLRRSSLRSLGLS